MRNKQLFLAASAALFVLSSGAALADTVNYTVTVNTGSLNGTYGYIELQLQPGTLTPAPVNANVTALHGASLNPSDTTYPPTGNFTGSLDTNDLILLNYSGSSSSPTFGPADYVEGINFTSNQITFNLSISGVGSATPAGTTSGTQFDLDFFDASGNYLLTTDPGGNNPVTPVNPDPDYYAGVVDLDYQGNVTTNGSAGGANDVTFGTTLATPEPSFAVLSGLICVSLILVGRRRLGSAHETD
jgi:hypothetical protein